MSMRLARGGLAALVLLSVGCLSPTQVTLVITTNVECTRVNDTAIIVGSNGTEIESKSPATVTSTCDTGRIGTIVLVPGGNREASFAVKVVTGVGVGSEDCAKGVVKNVPGAATGCIYSRRELGFIPQTPLVLPIAMHRACIGIDCGAGKTCTEDGSCTSAVVDPRKCSGPGGCDESALGPMTGTGGAGTGGMGGGGTGGMASSSSGMGGTGGMASSSSGMGGTGGMASSSSTTSASSSSTTSASSSSTTSASSSSTTSASSSSTTSASSSSTSASSSSTTSASSSSGGCSGPCDTPPSECYSPAGFCAGMVCMYPPEPSGTTCSIGQCDGAGTCVGCSGGCNNPPGECWTPVGACVSNMCMYTPLSPGTPCSIGQCDIAGTCVPGSSSSSSGGVGGGMGAGGAPSSSSSGGFGGFGGFGGAPTSSSSGSFGGNGGAGGAPSSSSSSSGPPPFDGGKVIEGGLEAG